MAEEAELFFQTPDQPSTLPFETIGASDGRIEPRRHRVTHAPVISMDELLRRTRILIQERFLLPELFIAAAVRHLAMTTACELAQRRREARHGRPMRRTTGGERARRKPRTGGRLARRLDACPRHVASTACAPLTQRCRGRAAPR